MTTETPNSTYIQDRHKFVTLTPMLLEQAMSRRILQRVTIMPQSTNMILCSIVTISIPLKSTNIYHRFLVGLVNGISNPTSILKNSSNSLFDFEGFGMVRALVFMYSRLASMMKINQTGNFTYVHM